MHICSLIAPLEKAFFHLSNTETPRYRIETDTLMTPVSCIFPNVQWLAPKVNVAVFCKQKTVLKFFFLNKISISHACMSVLVSISVQLDTVSGGYNGIKKKKEKN